jgi:hypothetical protein
MTEIWNNLTTIIVSVIAGLFGVINTRIGKQANKPNEVIPDLFFAELDLDTQRVIEFKKKTGIEKPACEINAYRKFHKKLKMAKWTLISDASIYYTEVSRGNVKIKMSKFDRVFTWITLAIPLISIIGVSVIEMVNPKLMGDSVIYPTSVIIAAAIFLYSQWRWVISGLSAMAIELRLKRLS